MSREWKAGDVAMATATGGQFLVVRTGHGERAYWSAPMDWPRGVSDYECEFRPLVVIDPEDREAVERLLRLEAEQHGQPDAIKPHHVPAMQAALREYANPKPPRPDEPQGLGAVVEDEDGTKWVRHDSVPIHRRWLNTDDCDTRFRSWDEIDPVRVLSPGVEVDQ